MNSPLNGRLFSSSLSKSHTWHEQVDIEQHIVWRPIYFML